MFTTVPVSVTTLSGLTVPPTVGFRLIVSVHTRRKLAVTVAGAVKVTVVFALSGLATVPPPVTVQLSNLWLLAGVAVMVIGVFTL